MSHPFCEKLEDLTKTEGHFPLRMNNFEATECIRRWKGAYPKVEFPAYRCPRCGRYFSHRSIAGHKEACLRAPQGNPEPYDSLAERWRGTMNEPCLPWLRKKLDPPPRLTEVKWRVMQSELNEKLNQLKNNTFTQQTENEEPENIVSNTNK